MPPAISGISDILAWGSLTRELTCLPPSARSLHHGGDGLRTLRRHTEPLASTNMIRRWSQEPKKKKKKVNQRPTTPDLISAIELPITDIEISPQPPDPRHASLLSLVAHLWSARVPQTRTTATCKASRMPLRDHCDAC
jgi:hypothetical protein